MSGRTFPRDVRMHNGRASSALIITCRKCQREEHFIATGGSKIGPLRYFKNRGWEVGKSPSMDTCAMCSKPARIQKPKVDEMVQTLTTAKAEQPREMGRDDRRIIFAKIDEVYIGNGYQAPWTDVAVAKDLGVPLAWVAKVRDEMFGPAGSNSEIDEVLTEIAGLRKVATDLQAEMLALSTRGAAYFNTLKSVEAAAAKIAKAVGK